jgi:hypothetical protein
VRPTLYNTRSDVKTKGAEMTAKSVSLYLLIALLLAPATAHAEDHLLVDEYMIARQSGLTRTVEPPTKRGVILDYEGSKNATPYVSVIKQGGRFRLWYNLGWDGLTSKPGVIGHHLGYLESQDGVTWNGDPVSQATPPIVFGASVAPTPAGYLFGWWATAPGADSQDIRKAGMWLASSPDGAAWQAVVDRPVLPGVGDIISVFYDQQRQRYVALAKDDAVDEIRNVVQSTSRDLRTWTTPRLVVTSGARDAHGTQFYGIDGVVQRDGLLIGMLRVLNDELEDGVGYTTLVWSRDGRTWTRDREPFLSRSSNPAAFDHAMAWGSAQVVDGNRTLIYYGGYQDGHKAARYGGRRIGVATMRRDRYVAREGTGVLVTRAFRHSGGGLVVNARVGGALAATVKTRGRVVRCSAPRRDAVTVRLRCATRLPAGTSRVTFRLRDASLYSFSVA